MDKVALHQNNAEQGASAIQFTARIVGILYLVQLSTAMISHINILEPILYGEHLLNDVAANPDKVILGMLLDMVCGACVFAIGVLLFPILKRISEPVALWYLGFRLNEWITLTISGALLLAIVSLGKQYAAAGMPAESDMHLLGKYLLKVRGSIKGLMLLGFCLSATPFYYLLFRSKLIPRFISIWGLIGILLLFTEVIANIYGRSVGGITIMLPMGLNEIFLGVWLMVKGFNKDAFQNYSAATNIN